MTTARFVGRFLFDPVDVPTEVVDYLATRLQIADASAAKVDAEQRQTPFDHQEEVGKAHGLRHFAEAEFAAWVDTGHRGRRGRPTRLFAPMPVDLRPRPYEGGAIPRPGERGVGSAVAAWFPRRTSRRASRVDRPAPSGQPILKH
ncbi:protein of unknown function [Marinactinospora thermotolerans DSM 45154]|uniref:DUF4158 domain-containing protein n=1 Tax=Marinactinospora thermotolerans DSM 45154 TaxID=1122192 RepID=A0A1T4PG55_9ACTN|nr:protein of unknown function [Marinactinospora thermotolerans DSM 45154]